MSTSLPFDARGLVVLVAYLFVCLAVGGIGHCKKKAEGENTLHDHFLAGRQGLPTAVLLGTLFAQTLSGWVRHDSCDLINKFARIYI